MPVKKARMYKKDGRPRCTVCNHKSVNEIDARLLNGESPARIAKLFPEVKKGALGRHRASHLSAILPKRLDPVEISKQGDKATMEVGDIIAQVRELYKRARDSMDSADEKNDSGLSIKANAQALRCLEVYFKSAQTAYQLSKEANTKGDMMTLSNVVLGALVDFPEAKLKVIEALQKMG